MNRPYATAVPVADELAWLRDDRRVYARKPSLRGTGRDTREREFVLRQAAAWDRVALEDGTPQSAQVAEEAAERLWIIDGWDENWERKPLREYVRWAYERWVNTPAGPEHR